MLGQTNQLKYNINMAEQKQSKMQNLDAGQLALRCAQFFMTLSESCFQFYNKFNRQKERKTKLIKKAQKQKPRQIRRPQGEQQLNQDLKKKLPKKPLTAYIIYFQEKKPNFVQRYPGLNLSDLTKLIAKQWKQIDGNQRKPYLQQAQQDRKRYETEMKQFKQRYGTVTQQNQQQIEQNQNQAEQASSNHNGRQENLIKSDKADENQNLDQEKGEDSNQIQNQNQNENQGQGQGEAMQNEGQNQSENPQAADQSSQKQQEQG